MKAPYFTPENIQEKSAEMLREIREYIPARNFPFVPNRSALLVIDMQKYFLDDSSHAKIPSARTIIPVINELVKAFSSEGLPVIFTRHLNTTENAGMLAKWWSEVIEKENPLSEISDELDTGSGIILEKSQYDAFYETRLKEILREKDIEQVVICGVMTHLCCETTARSAFVRGFEVLFVVDANATYNEQHHTATLLNLAHGFALPVLTEEILDAFG